VENIIGRKVYVFAADYSDEWELVARTIQLHDSSDRGLSDAKMLASQVKRGLTNE